MILWFYFWVIFVFIKLRTYRYGIGITWVWPGQFLAYTVQWQMPVWKVVPNIPHSVTGSLRFLLNDSSQIPLGLWVKLQASGSGISQKELPGKCLSKFLWTSDLNILGDSLPRHNSITPCVRYAITDNHSANYPHLHGTIVDLNSGTRFIAFPHWTSGGMLWLQRSGRLHQQRKACARGVPRHGHW